MRLQVGAQVTSLDDALLRSTLMSERIRHRTDQALRELIDSFTGKLDFHPLEDLTISEQAWDLVAASGIESRLVFAHPLLPREHPQTSQYYRGIAFTAAEARGGYRCGPFPRGKMGRASCPLRKSRARA